jgi:acetyl esterase/lipase
MYLAALLTALVAAGAHGETKRVQDVIYGRRAGMALTMDVFTPDHSNGCGVIFTVNGAWLSSHDDLSMVHVTPQYYATFLTHGYTVFAVVTSSQPWFPVLNQIADMHRAVRFIRSRSGDYGVRPDCLGITGSSSGGELSLMIATQGGPGKQDAPDPVDRKSSAVQAAAVFFPPTDFLNWGEDGTNGVGVLSMQPIQTAFGPLAFTPEGRQLLGRAISPIYFLTSQLPPTFIVHGDQDKVVPLQQSQRFVQQARSLHVRAIELVIRPGKGHGWPDFWLTPEDMGAFVAWFDRYLVGGHAAGPDAIDVFSGRTLDTKESR